MNKKLSLLFFLGLIVLVGSTNAGAEKEGFVSVNQLDYEIFYAPKSPRPGQALVVALHFLKVIPGTSKQQSLKVKFIERDFFLQPFVDGWHGVAAVPLETKPGSYQLSIIFKEGEELVLPITVLAHDYGEQRLTVPKEMATPMKPENLKKIKRDRQSLRLTYASSGTSLLLEEEVRPPLTSTITSPFGLRRLFNGTPKAPHGGVDFRAGVGVPIATAATGRVALAEDLYYSGNLVIIDHGLDIFTLYMHLDKISCRPGDIVHPGQIIGTAGSSGRVTGPHLHWGVKIAGVYVDPLRFVTDSKHLLEVPWEAEKWQKK